MNLVLLTFGERLENHYQAVFCILSFLKDVRLKRAIIVTDRPEFYQILKDRVEIIQIDQNTLQDWKGKYNFFWRVKIKALEVVQRKYPQEHILYVDSDTFLVSDLAEIQQELDLGCSFMHTFEYNLKNTQSRTFKRMMSVLNQKTFAGISLNDNSEMWNAGVIALPASKAQALIENILNCCDEMCATPCERRLLEQFSFSLVLKNLTNLSSCEKSIAHYWGNKEEWNQFIQQFLVNIALKNISLAESIALFNQIEFPRIPLEKKKRSSAEKLKKLIDKLLPIKKMRYLSQH